MKHKLVFMVICLSIMTLSMGCTIPSTTSTVPPTLIPTTSSTAPSTTALTTPPESTAAALNATEVLGPVITAMRQVTSVNIGTNIVDQYSIQGPSGMMHTTSIWDGQRAVDIVNNQMHLTMNIDNFADGFYLATKTNAYYDKENAYLQTWSSGGFNPQGRWYRSKLNEEFFPADKQLSPVIELLVSANQTISLTTGKLDGPKYQVITFSPSAEAVADWVLSQGFEGGPSVSYSTGPSLVGKTVFEKTFKGGTFQIWVDSDTNLVMKAYFAPVFQATLDELNQIYGYTQSGQEQYYESDYVVQLDFSGYNLPADVQIPPEALSAPGN